MKRSFATGGYGIEKLSIHQQNSKYISIDVGKKSRAIYALVFLSNSLFASGHYNVIKIWDLKRKKCIKEIKHHNEELNFLYLFDPNTLISGSSAQLASWSLKSYELIKEFDFKKNPMDMCKYTENTALILSQDKSIYLLKDMEVSHFVKVEKPPCCLCWIRDKEYAVGCSEGVLFLYKETNLIKTIEFGDEPFYRLSLLPWNGKLLTCHFVLYGI